MTDLEICLAAIGKFIRENWIIISFIIIRIFLLAVDENWERRVSR